MPLQAVEPRRLYRQVADQLRQLIDSGEFAVGNRLPTERELAAQLGVSRPTVREALIALEVDGRVRIRVGSGIYVLAPQEPTTIAAPAVAGSFEILAARALFEGAIAEQAAQIASPADLAGIDATLARMKGAAESGCRKYRCRPRLSPRRCGRALQRRHQQRRRRSFRSAHQSVFRAPRKLFRDAVELARGVQRTQCDPRLHRERRSRRRAGGHASPSGAIAGALLPHIWRCRACDVGAARHKTERTTDEVDASKTKESQSQHKEEMNHDYQTRIRSTAPRLRCSRHLPRRRPSSNGATSTRRRSRSIRSPFGRQANSPSAPTTNIRSRFSRPRNSARKPTSTRAFRSARSTSSFQDRASRPGRIRRSA